MQLGAEGEISFEVVYFWRRFKGQISQHEKNILTKTMQMDGAAEKKVAQHGGSHVAEARAYLKKKSF